MRKEYLIYELQKEAGLGNLLKNLFKRKSATKVDPMKLSKGYSKVIDGSFKNFSKDLNKDLSNSVRRVGEELNPVIEEWKTSLIKDLEEKIKRGRK